MKNRILTLVLTLVLLLSALAGCGSKTGSPTGKTDTPAQSGTNAAVSENADPPSGGAEEAEELYPAPDYSDFEMPEETDKLVVYIGEFTSKVMTQALRLFEETYPNVQVDYQIMKDSECRERIRTEVAAGKGPDIILATGTDLPDIYKTMATSILEDLNPYVMYDPDFELSDYIRSVMEGGMMYGKRYILPVAYQYPMLLTTKEILSDIGVEPETLGTYQGFMNACVAYRDSKPDGKLFEYVGNSSNLRNLFEYVGFRMIDYERNTVSFNEERFRQMIEVCRLFEGTVPNGEFADMAGTVLADKGCLFGKAESVMLTLWDCVLLRMYGFNPILTLATDENDGATAQISYFSAVPGGAANKLNGWRLIKILLSDAIQYGIDDTKQNQMSLFPVGNPVRIESMQKLIRYFGSSYIEEYPDFITEADIQYFLDTSMAVSDAAMRPTVIYNDVMDNMTPYIEGKDAYEKCLGRLMNELELYKDE